MDIFNEKELAAFKEIGMADRAGPIKLRYISSTKGPKGSIPHEDLDVSDLRAKSEDLINYLRQDILILGGVMLKAQEINWSKYQIDIEGVMTVSALSLKIFRKFIGIFYSEELKFARDLGYHIIPLRGYLFEAMSSPFEGIISDLYESRLEAKKRDLQSKRYEELMKMDNFQSAEMLTENYYIVNYITNSSFAEDDNWKAPKMSAVQLAAAVTACARIHMYPYISRPDCYYTDTDSVVLGCPLSDDLISSMEMGKFKLEYFVKKGIFLAPKSYMLETVDEQHVIRHKGPAKDLVTSEWFKKQLADPSLTELIPTHVNFRIDWKKFQIGKKDILIKLGLPQSTKRENVYDSENVWIETRPINVIDLGSKDATTILKYELLRLSVSQSTTEGQKTPTEGQKTPTEGQKTPTEGKNTPTEGQKATTVQPTLYNTKDHDNSIPKPDE
uniref:DNA-directed DNA polymerase n=1 Tax=Ananas comosus var. bracteatus TaxID=296719 RepID=A0A6V7PYP7_ANACO|nr:unnamed protein product [Ananas comosus var. bracteatus]